MVARGETDHATRSLLVAEGQELVERPANLEGARTLEVLALEKDVAAAPLVERAARDHGRAVNAPLEARRRGANILEIDGAHLARL